MDIAEKAKAYDELRFLVESLYPTMNDYQKEKVVGILPELGESEDEGILRIIIEGFRNYKNSFNEWNKTSVDKIIAYLEKQKEKPNYLSVNRVKVRPDGRIERHTIGYLEKQEEQKSTEVEQNSLVRVLKDRKAITEDIRNGIPTKTIEKERNVKFATPVDMRHTEWGKEDESILEALIYDIERLPMQGVLTHRPCDSYIKFLKALRPGWKPSEEQISVLEFIIGNHIFGHQEHQGVLESLLFDLKKLCQ